MHKREKTYPGQKLRNCHRKHDLSSVIQIKLTSQTMELTDNQLSIPACRPAMQGVRGE